MIPPAVPAFIAACVLFLACTSIHTDNPTNPEADNPIVEGDEVMPPMGCTLWRIEKGDDADC